jgi:hypothetical protein
MFLIKLGEVRVFNHNLEFFLKPLAGVPKICRVTNFSIFKNVRIPNYAAAQRVFIVHGRVGRYFEGKNQKISREQFLYIFLFG